MNAKRMINAVGGTRSAEWKSMPHTKDAKSAKKNSRFLFSLSELGVLEERSEQARDLNSERTVNSERGMEKHASREGRQERQGKLQISVFSLRAWRA